MKNPPVLDDVLLLTCLRRVTTFHKPISGFSRQWRFAPGTWQGGNSTLLASSVQRYGSKLLVRGFQEIVRAVEFAAEAAIEGVQASVDALKLLSGGWSLKIEIVIVLGNI